MHSLDERKIVRKKYKIIITVKNFTYYKRSDRRVILERSDLFIRLIHLLIRLDRGISYFHGHSRAILFARSFVPLTARRSREAPPPPPPPTFLAPLFPFVPCFHYNRLFYSFAVSRHRWNGANNRESIRLARNGPVSCPYGQSGLSSTFQRRLFRWSPPPTNDYIRSILFKCDFWFFDAW